MREPSLTPAGVFTREGFLSRRRPWPPQVGQGSSITVPLPPQREHGRVMENTPWPCASTPRPLQTGHTLGVVPGRAPLPRQVVQALCVATVTGTWAPSMACSKDSVTVVSRSLPFSVAGLVRARPELVLKIPDRMSENEPKSAAVAPPPVPPPNGPPPAKTEPPRSYFLRLSASPRTS